MVIKSSSCHAYLRPCPFNELGSNSPVDLASLLFTFQPHGYQPISLFHVLTSRLLRTREFVLDKIRYRNKITFLYGQAIVEILSTISYLQVCMKNCDALRYAFLRKMLKTILDSIVEKVPHMKEVTVKIDFFCPNSTDSNKPPHVATLKKCKVVSQNEESQFLACDDMWQQQPPNDIFASGTSQSLVEGLWICIH